MRKVVTRPRKAAVMLISAVIGTTVITAPAVAAQAAGSDVQLARFYQQQVQWAACQPDDSGAVPPGTDWSKFDCATVIVPLDYRHPDAGNLSIAVSRVKAADPAKRQGVLLLNPGGPGGSGLFMEADFLDQKIATSYDLIGFDPRGVGRSTQLQCEVIGTPLPPDNRPTDAEFPAIVAAAKQQEEGCQRAGGGIRPFINTANTARDMDLIRAVLGEKKINYLGFSYGTYLGAVYGSLFPQNLNRSVLDSSVNPNWLWREQQLQVGVAAKQNVDAWATWVAQRNKTYGLGTSLAQVTTNLDALGVKLAAKPVPPISPPMPKNFPVDRVFFDSILGAVTSDRSQWDILGQVVDQLSAEATSSAKLSPDASTALGLMAEQTLSGIAKTESGVYQAVTCEADWPSDPATYYDDMRLYREKYPYGGGAMAAEPSNCTFRSFTPPEKLVDLKRKGYPAGLVLQGEYDGETQYEGGPAMASKLDDNLVSVTDEGVHGLYASNACATERIDDYLINGILPGSRSLCAGEPRPDVPADNAPAVPKAKSGQSLASQEQAIIAKDKLNRNF